MIFPCKNRLPVNEVPSGIAPEYWDISGSLRPDVAPVTPVTRTILRVRVDAWIVAVFKGLGYDTEHIGGVNTNVNTIDMIKQGSYCI